MKNWSRPLRLLRIDANEIGDGGELELLYLGHGHQAGVEMQQPKELQRHQVPKPSIGDAGPRQVQGDHTDQTWVLTKREKREGGGGKVRASSCIPEMCLIFLVYCRKILYSEQEEQDYEKATRRGKKRIEVQDCFDDQTL